MWIVVFAYVAKKWYCLFMKKEKASIPVRIYPSSHRFLKIKAAKKRTSIAKIVKELTDKKHETMPQL